MDMEKMPHLIYRMRFRILYSVIFIFCANLISAQNFFRSYGNTDDEVANDVIETKDSAFFLFGTSSSFVDGTSNFYLIRIDSTGAFGWSKSYGGNGIDQGHSISLKPNGHYLLTGYSNSFNSGYDILNIEIDSLGNEIWSKNIGGDDWDFAYGNLTLSNGNSLIAGSTFSYGNGNRDAFLWMIDDNGDSLWMKTFGSTEDDEMRKSIFTSTGEIISVGYTTVTTGDRDILLVKMKTNGDTLWTKKYGTAMDDEGFSLAESASGNYIIAGYSAGVGAGGKEGYYFQTDTAGIMMWNQNFGGAGEDIFHDICVKKNENRFYAAWETNSIGNGEYDFTLSSLYITGGWYAAGNSYGTAMSEKPYGIIYTSHNRVLAVGSTNFPYGNSNVLAVMSDTLFPTQLTMTSYIDVTAINENSASAGISIYPNPSNSNISIRCSEEISRIEIIDLNGKVVLMKENNFESINVSILPPSVYLLKTGLSNGGTAIHRLVVTKQ